MKQNEAIKNILLYFVAKWLMMRMMMMMMMMMIKVNFIWQLNSHSSNLTVDSAVVHYAIIVSEKNNRI